MRKPFENEETCRKCGGKCCQGLPGACAPEDFGSSKEEIETAVEVALRSGDWQIDRWEGKARLPSGREVDGPWWVRPRVLDGRDWKVFSYTWGGACVSLGPEGCRLEPSRRPYECRNLEPRDDGDCVAHYKNKLTVSEMWLDAGVDLEAIGKRVLDLPIQIPVEHNQT